jgi:hypothetical protein
MSDAPARVTGVRLDLRLIQPEDAAYVHALRCNPAYNAYLSPVAGTADDQRRWIDCYKQREADGREAYYIIERRTDGRPCGLVRLYGIEGDRFTWGSWILGAGKPPKAALESALLSFGVGFEQYAKTLGLIDVRRRNERALAFYRRFGMAEVSADERDIYFRYTRDQFVVDRPGHWRVIGNSGEAS